MRSPEGQAALVIRHWAKAYWTTKLRRGFCVTSLTGRAGLTCPCKSDRLSPLLQALSPVPTSFRVEFRAHARTLMLRPGSFWAASLQAPPHTSHGRHSAMCRAPRSAMVSHTSSTDMRHLSAWNILPPPHSLLTCIIHPRCHFPQQVLPGFHPGHSSHPPLPHVPLS